MITNEVNYTRGHMELAKAEWIRARVEHKDTPWKIEAAYDNYLIELANYWEAVGKRSIEAGWEESWEEPVSEKKEKTLREVTLKNGQKIKY